MQKNKFISLCVPATLAVALCLCACKKEETQCKTNTAACYDSEKCADSATTKKTDTANEKLLSHHDTKAVFKGKHQHQCHGMTMLCPDKCGDSGTLAVFDIASYNSYQKPDRYGDDPASQYMFMLQSTTGTSDVSPEIADLVNSLTPGDEVNLVWDHVYVSDNNANYPKRIVRKITPLGTRTAVQNTPETPPTPMPASRMTR